MKKFLLGPVFVLLVLSVILSTSRGEATDVQVNGSFSATGFSGDGSALTNINASSLTGIVPIINGGTGSSAQNFVDLTTTQVIGGTKTFSNTISGNISGNAATATTAQGVVANAIVPGSLADGAVTPSKISFYGSMAIVAISGGNYSDPATAMSDYSTWCGTPSSTNPCLLKIMPGVYHVVSPVVMQSYIDIEGSGENTTTIIGAISSSNPYASGTVTGASNAEIRFLTVANTGTGAYTEAILNSASFSMLHVTATASGGLHNYGVYNTSSSPTMTNVTATASGGSYNYGVNNISSSPTMVNVTAAGSGAGIVNYGVRNISSSPTMINVTVTASGALAANYGVANDSSSPTMTNVTVTASGETAIGVDSFVSGTVKINHSVISGSTHTIINQSGTTLYVGNTQLDGGSVSNSGTMTCAGVYDGSYTFYASTCP